jgi:hypothetical protein
MYLLIMISLVACGTQDADPSIEEPKGDEIQLSEQTDVPYTLVTSDQSPVDIQDKVEEMKMKPSTEVITIGDRDYIIVTMGEQSTGGYEVMIHQVVEVEAEVRVWYEFKSPGQDDSVTEAFTYPYAIVEMEHSDKPIVFNEVEAEKIE